MTAEVTAVQGPEDPQAPAPCAPRQAALRFDGTGAEYFRIWIVNLLLTLLTFGLFSAWAKVRKARWFARHTVLLDDRFDFHGDPRRILLGRVLALGLLVLWTHAFQIHAGLGLAVLALLCALGPQLFAGAQRFRLANTSWRGLRLGFEVPRRRIYALGLPVLLIWTSGTVLAQLGVNAVWVAGAGLLAVLTMPWGHARLKAVQHGHARFGGQAFRFESDVAAFYGLYLKALGLLVLAGFAAALLAGFGSALVGERFAALPTSMRLFLNGIGGLLFGWLVVWPFFAARLQALVWSRTQWGPVRFRTAMRAGRLWRLVLVQTLLTVFSLGLYWPFATVALARYRIGSVVVETDGDWPTVQAAGPAATAPDAAGDAAADFFGLDLGW